MRVLYLLLLIALFPSFESKCRDYKQQRIVFKCLGKRLRAGLAMEVYFDDPSERNIQEIGERCDEFNECIEPSDGCLIASFENVRTWCDRYANRERMNCFDKLVNDKENNITEIFATCITAAGGKLNASECAIVKNCTLRVVHDHCHELVVVEVTKKFGNVFYDSDDCDAEETKDGPGSQRI